MTQAEFTRMCKAFTEATEEQKEMALALMNEAEREVFLIGVGCYRIMTDKKYHDMMMAETMKQYLRG